MAFLFSDAGTSQGKNATDGKKMPTGKNKRWYQQDMISIDYYM